MDSDCLFDDDSSQRAVSRFVGSPALSNKRLRCKARISEDSSVQESAKLKEACLARVVLGRSYFEQASYQAIQRTGWYRIVWMTSALKSPFS